MAIDFNHIRDCLKRFEFQQLFVEELGWSRPANRAEAPFSVKDARFTRRPVAQLAGAAVFEIAAESGTIPDAKLRAAVEKEIAKQHHENVLIFVDAERTQSLWYWAKRQNGKFYPRDLRANPCYPWLQSESWQLILTVPETASNDSRSRICLSRSSAGITRRRT